jgi:hypothetical protein
MDAQGNIVHMPYSPDQGPEPTSFNKLEGTDVAMDSGIKAQERALVELGLRLMGSEEQGEPALPEAEPYE